MSKILGLDLGTNSIGWAIRNTDLIENQIEKFGVVTFNKGIGLGKTGEFSYAAERTKKRSTRRLYQARKYRLWATLNHLITEGYCPLTIEDLNKWRYYSKEEAYKNNNAGRIYPIWNAAFEAWIKLDFDNDGKPDYQSPYQLRKEIAETELDFTKEVNRFKLGRALYHIAQRRGFKSSRKSADDSKEKETEENEVIDLQYSEKKRNKIISNLFEKYVDAKTVGWLFALLENDKIRIRESIAQYAIRENYKDEIKFIFRETQKLGLEHPLYKKLVETGNNKNDGSIFYKRPLRSQKGLVGKCTLEPNKYRAPISHPAFEAFRAWAFLNNIKFKENNQWKPLPIELKQEIYDELFFRKSKSYFPFSEISTLIKKKGKDWQLNYSFKTTVTACPVSARLKDIFGNDYLNIKIKKDKKSKSGKDFYDLEDIWHVLFNYEDQEYVTEFAKEKLKLSDVKTGEKERSDVEKFVIAWNACPVGYGMLSINAINKINLFLMKGLIYTEAVLLANIPEIIGKKLWQENEQLLLSSVSNIIAENRQQKTILNIVNNLVSKHKNLDENKFGYKNNNYILAESDLNDIQNAIDEQFGISNWNSLPEDEKKYIFDTVKDCYQGYFAKQGMVRNNGNEERIVTIRSGNRSYHKTETGYYRLPKLIDTLKEFLYANFDHLEETKISRIYHPSEIYIYPPAKEIDGMLKLGSPKTGSFKNPMAMRTLHELRKLMNYMIETNQIDNETRVVVEVARDLNDANKRWAIGCWQRQREAENQKFEEAIKQLLGEDKSIKASAESNEDINKMRLFYEQNTEQTLPEVIEVEENAKGKRKKSAEKDEAIRWSGLGNNLIDKYRLWKEQGYQCLYTGKFIKLSDLFNENVIDFEHTIPRSKSFDNSLANLTVCYHDYNRTIKKNQIPTDLPNYDKEFDFGGNIGKCTAILPRLEAWQDKVERIKQQIDFWKTKSKKATDKSWKDDAIRQVHLWRMELDYWKNKLDRFTITEITSGFKNSQKVDTQLISKYAFHYLKTYFERVEVQKGSITAEFRKIYKLQVADEKKDRSKHSHHAKDAAVLTLIPVAAKRDEILEKYYEEKEKNLKATFTVEPYKGFKREFVWSIDDSLLINNIVNNQALTPAKRKVRKRGKEVIINGNIRWATGDSIRGQLHQDTFYGAIRPAQIGANGNLLRDENGKFIQEENIKYVQRIPFNVDFTGIDKIVDEGLKKQIKEHVQRAGSFKKAFEEGIYLLDKNRNPHGNKIRHIRVWASVSEPLPIKKHTHLSDKEYKQHYWAANGENFAYGLYENDQKHRGFKLLSLFNVSRLSGTSDKLREMFEQEIEIKRPQGKVQLKYVLTSGLKVIFYKENISEIHDLKNDLRAISNRLYIINSFEKDGRIKLTHHIDSRSDNDLKALEEIYGKAYWQGFSQVNFENPYPKLKLSKDSLNFAVESYDFEIKMDGVIHWK
ncbi:MAG: HNH endonuclease domain-containing protein [Bacteroidia bacterium]